MLIFWKIYYWLDYKHFLSKYFIKFDITIIECWSMMRTCFNMRVSTNVHMRIRVHAFFFVRTFWCIFFMTNREYLSIPLFNMIYHLYFVLFLYLCHSLILFFSVLSLSLSLLLLFIISFSIAVCLCFTYLLTELSYAHKHVCT